MAASIAAAAAIVTLILVIYQVKLQREQTRLARDQTRLAERQTQLIERQDEILVRRARLELIARVRPKALDMTVREGWVRIEFRIENRGGRGASNYYWHLYFPRVWPYEWEGGVVQPTHKDRIYRRGGLWFRYFAGYVDRPLHPKRSSVIGSMRIPQDRLPFTIEWQATCDDGAFPGDDPGPTEVKADDPDSAPQNDEEAQHGE